jgi:putative flippase GtrA
MIVVSTPTIVMTFFPAETLDTYEIALNILIIAVTFIGVFLLSEFLLFNKKSKIINRLNFFA